MKIACVQPSLAATAGGERQVLTLAIELQKMGCNVELFTTYVDYERCFPALLRQVKVKSLYGKIEHLRTKNLASWLARKRAVWRLALDVGLNYKSLYDMINLGMNISSNFDIVNCHNFPSEWAAFIAKRNMRTKTVWMCNEPPFWYYHKSPYNPLSWPLYELWDKLATRHIDLIVTLDNLNMRRIRNIYRRQAVVIRSGVDVEHFNGNSGDDIRRRYGLTKQDFILLQVGALTHYKRQIDSLRVLESLSKRGHVKLMLIGCGNGRDELEKLAHELNIEKRVVFVDSVEESDLPKYYGACDVLIFPSEQTWGLAAVEAMASSKPVIASMASGVSEIIEHGVTGYVVPPRCPGDIAKYVTMLIDDPSLRKGIGERARKYVRENLSWKRYATGMLKIFRLLLENRHKEKASTISDI